MSFGKLTVVVSSSVGPLVFRAANKSCLSLFENFTLGMSLCFGFDGAHAQSRHCGIHSLNSWCSINLEWFEVMQESRLMFLSRTNTSPLVATCVTSGGSLQSALYLGNVISVFWQGVPTACCCRLMTHLGWAYGSLLFHACQYDNHVL